MLFFEQQAQWLGQIAEIAEELALQPTRQVRYRVAVVDIAGSDLPRQKLAAIRNEQVQFEAVETSQRSFAARRNPGKLPVLWNP